MVLTDEQKRTLLNCAEGWHFAADGIPAADAWGRLIACVQGMIDAGVDRARRYDETRRALQCALSEGVPSEAVRELMACRYGVSKLVDMRAEDYDDFRARLYDLRNAFR